MPGGALEQGRRSPDRSTGSCRPAPSRRLPRPRPPGARPAPFPRRTRGPPPKPPRRRRPAGSCSPTGPRPSGLRLRPLPGAPLVAASRGHGLGPRPGATTTATATRTSSWSTRPGPLTLGSGRGRALARARSRLFRNDGDGTLHRRDRRGGRWRSGAGAWARPGATTTATGTSTCFVTRYGTNLLFRNDGEGGFRDVSERGGRRGAREGFWAGVSWADFDRDGDLDAYVCGYVRYTWDPEKVGQGTRQFQAVVPYTLNPSSYPPSANLLLRNDGGVFRDVAREAGVDNPSRPLAVGVVARLRRRRLAGPLRRERRLRQRDVPEPRRRALPRHQPLGVGGRLPRRHGPGDRRLGRGRRLRHLRDPLAGAGERPLRRREPVDEGDAGGAAALRGPGATCSASARSRSTPSAGGPASSTTTTTGGSTSTRSTAAPSRRRTTPTRLVPMRSFLFWNARRQRLLRGRRASRRRPIRRRPGRPRGEPPPTTTATATSTSPCSSTGARCGSPATTAGTAGAGPGSCCAPPRERACLDRDTPGGRRPGPPGARVTAHRRRHDPGPRGRAGSRRT